MSIISFGFSKKSFDDDTTTIKTSMPNGNSQKKIHSMAIRSDSYGYNPEGHHGGEDADAPKIDSLTYEADESEVFRAYVASQHYRQRGNFWNDGKRETLLRYFNLTLIGILQGFVAYFTNVISHSFIKVSFPMY